MKSRSPDGKSANHADNTIIVQPPPGFDLVACVESWMQVPELGVEYEPGLGRGYGVARISYKDGVEKAEAGPQKIQIHYSSDTRLQEFLRLLQQNVVPRDLKGEWVTVSERLGRRFFIEEVVRTQFDLFEERSLRMPRLEAWRSVFGTVEKPRSSIKGSDVLSGLDRVAEITVKDFSAKDTSKEPPNLLARTRARTLFELPPEMGKS